MQEAQLKFTQKPWDGSASRWKTVEDLMASIPSAMRRRGKRLAAAANRAVTKSDCSLPYREPVNHDVNINGISAALGRIDQVKNATAAEIASARAELQDQRTKARKALGLDKKKSMAEEIGDIGFSMIEEMLEAQAWAPVPEAAPFRNPAPEPVMVPPGVMPAMPQGIPAGNFGSALDTGYQTAVLDGGMQSIDTRLDTLNPTFLNPVLFSSHALAAQAAAPAPAPVSLANAEFAELPAEPAKLVNTDGIPGVVDNDYRPLPNWKALGINRPAGNATPAELKDLQGAMRPDGSPLQPEDVWSVGAMVCNDDLIAQFMAFIPPLELERLGVIAQTRAIKSDQDHSREVMSGNFTIAPSSILIGTDPGTTLHIDHPLLGKVPYTALIARLLFQKIPDDEDQMAAIEAAMAGKLQNLSIAFGFGSVTCALCGEVPVLRTIKDNGKILGFTIDPGSHQLLCSMQPDDFASWDSLTGTLRTPADTEGDYAYRTVRVTGCTMDGTVTIEPIPDSTFDLARGTVLMLDMGSFGFFFGGGRRYCRFHGSSGSYYGDGRRTVGMFTNIRSFINVAACDKGAVEARIIVDPDLARSAQLS